MAIPNKAHNRLESTSTETTKLKPGIKIVESEVVIEKTPLNDLRLDHLNVNYAQENGFFTGLLLALPVCIASWAILIWGIELFLF